MRSPIVINASYPFFKTFNAMGSFHIVAHFTTWNDVSDNISKIVVNSVYSVVNIRAVASSWMINLRRFFSTIATFLGGDFSEKFYIKRKFIFSILCIKLCISIKRPKSTFVFRETPTAPATSRKAHAQRISFCDLFVPTITPAKKFNWTPWYSLYHSKFSVPVSSFVYIFSHSVLLNGDLRKSWRRYRGDISDLRRSRIKNTPSDLFASISGL